jgi:hypothetical protein
MKTLFLSAVLALLGASAHAAVAISGLSPSHGPLGTVVTITGSGFTGAPHVALVTSTAPEVYTIVNDSTILYTVPADAQLVAQPLQIFVNSLEAEAIFTVDAGSVPAPPAAFVPPEAPRCMIDSSFGNFHMGTSAAGDTVAAIWCDDQASLGTWYLAGNPKAVPLPSCLLGAKLTPSWTLAYLQAAWSACSSLLVPLTADQQAEADILVKLWTPRLSVTGPANQNVYTANADGTRGPQLVVGGFGMQVAPAVVCGGLRLQNAGARFASVSGQLSTNGVTLPAGSYALCSITYPPATGFTN